MNGNYLSCRIYKKPVMYLLLFAGLGCQPDYSHFEPAPGVEGRMMDQLRADPEFSTFTEALELAGMDQFLNRSGLWTVIAPTNSAFTAGGIDIHKLSKMELTQLVGFHVLERMMFTGDFAKSKFSSSVQYRYATRSKKFVTVAQDGNSINGVKLLDHKKDIAARNGAIHGISEVMVPSPSIDNYLEGRADLSIFFKALQNFAVYSVDGENSVDRNGDGIIDDTVFVKTYTQIIDLANEPTLKTVYAPTNASFQQFFDDPEVPYNRIEDFKLSDPVDLHVLTTLLKGHLATGALPASGTVTTSGTESVTIASGDVENPNVTQSNGAVHVLKKLIIPPSLKSVSGRVLLNKELSKFAAALLKSSLVGAFNAAAERYTVFAPTNAAFVQAGIDPAQANVTAAVLAPILRFHIVTGRKILLDQLKESAAFLPTSHGTFVKQVNTGLTDNLGVISAVVGGDINAENGVVHKVDRVLTPPSKTVAQLLSENQYSQFRAALNRAGLNSELEKGNLTIFAPDNDAFFKLYTQLNAPGGLTDISVPRLDSILRYHIIPKRVFSLDLMEGGEIGTGLKGQNLTAVSSAGDIFLKDGNPAGADSKITVIDSQGTNGAVHTVNAVLLPKAY